MANMSDAQGSFSFDSKFYKMHKKLIESYLSETNLENFEVLTFIESCKNGTFNFSGSGRWSLDNSLPYLLNSDGETKSQYIKLWTEMKKANASLDINYVDIEEGMELSVEESATLYIDTQKEDEYLLKADPLSVNVEELPYTNRLLWEYNIETGYLIDNCFYPEDFKTIMSYLHSFYNSTLVKDSTTSMYSFNQVKRAFIKMIEANEEIFDGVILDWELKTLDELCDTYNLGYYLELEK